MPIAASLPDIHAHLKARFIFNFGSDPSVLQRRLAVPWLSPALTNGKAVCSVCFLSLARVTCIGMPKSVGLSNLNCAVRWAVTDLRTDQPAVWVENRFTGSKLASVITGLGFPGFHPHADIQIQNVGNSFSVKVIGKSDGPHFSASGRVTHEHRSELFRRVEDFEHFLKVGTRSYAPSISKESINVVDLHKVDDQFVPLSALAATDCVLSNALTLPKESLDSSFATWGGEYTWRFVEQLSTSAHEI